MELAERGLRVGVELGSQNGFSLRSRSCTQQRGNDGERRGSVEAKRSSSRAGGAADASSGMVSQMLKRRHCVFMSVGVMEVSSDKLCCDCPTCSVSVQ